MSVFSQIEGEIVVLLQLQIIQQGNTELNQEYQSHLQKKDLTWRGAAAAPAKKCQAEKFLKKVLDGWRFKCYI